jgi:multicomponent Na+:H+ antiporter subunit F
MTMTTFLLVAAALVLVTVMVALARLLLSAAAVDWVMAAQVLGTAGIASLLLFGVATASPGVIDLALLLALLAAFATVAFALRLARPGAQPRQVWASAADIGPTEDEDEPGRLAVTRPGEQGRQAGVQS